MHSSVCARCGTNLTEVEQRCPACGTAAIHNKSVADYADDHLRALLDTARHHQQSGDINLALQYAREALSFRNDCSTTHALLGHLYELRGNHEAARYHFQSALQIAVSCDESQSAMPPQGPTQSSSQPQSGVMLLVLIGCVLFSGLAVLFAFRPGMPQTEQGHVFQVTIDRPALNSEPRWTWTVPSPVPEVSSTPTPVVGGNPLAPVKSSVTDNQPGVAMPVSIPTSASPPPLPVVLGPAAHPHAKAAFEEVTVETADQAYFRGEYDKAVALYETVISREENPNPRLYQDMAWCYQQLGNSMQAADKLQLAVKGYRQLLDAESDSISAQQALASCEAALRILQTTRERESAP